MKYILSVLFILIVSALTPKAQACSCGYGGYWVSEFVEDKVVFEGQALQSTWREDISRSQFRYGTAETKFTVLKPLKDIELTEVLILHDIYDGASCGINYELGRKHIVIASYGYDGALNTSSCASNAVPEINLLEYFEQNKDVYIPSVWDCTDEQISNPNDPKNCYFLSDAAATERREKMKLRWEKEHEARLNKIKKPATNN